MFTHSSDVADGKNVYGHPQSLYRHLTDILSLGNIAVKRKNREREPLLASWIPSRGVGSNLDPTTSLFIDESVKSSCD